MTLPPPSLLIPAFAIWQETQGLTSQGKWVQKIICALRCDYSEQGHHKIPTVPSDTAEQLRVQGSKGSRDLLKKKKSPTVVPWPSWDLKFQPSIHSLRTLTEMVALPLI